MSRQSQLSPDNILRFLQLRNGPASLEDLSRSLQVRRSSRRALLQMLAKLKKRGLVEELSQGRFLLRQTPRPQQPSSKPRPAQEPPTEKFPQQKAFSRDEIKGRLVLHQDGYGFVVPDVAIPNLDGDLFIPRDFVEDAMHGDHVIAKITRLSGASGARRAEGRILRIVSRAHPSVVGLFRYTSRGCVVVPYDPRVQHEIELSAGEELSPALREQLLPGEKDRSGKRARLPHIPKLDGAVVNAELIHYAREGASPIGRVIEILGRPGDLGVDTEIIIRKHHLPHTFPGEVSHEAEQLARPVSESELSGREDFRSLPIVTIDGETARDFDDAVTVRNLADGNFELQVHIADVAQYVTPDSALDQEARLRGTSVYFPDRAVPMLPLELSTDICSLRPRLDRLVLSCVMQIDPRGEILGFELSEGVIRSAERMTYTAVNAVIEGDAAARERYAALVPTFELMRDLALILNRKRQRRGSIDFDLPEPVIEFDELGFMKSITRSERNIAHRLIEEFMLSANECVAHYLESKRIASLYRIHEKPDAKRVYDFEVIAATFGYSLGVGALPIHRVQFKSDRRAARGTGKQARTIEVPKDVHITPRMYQKLAAKIAGKPEERILSYLMLRSLKQARYSEENMGHFALAAPSYTHFTSPIRRYPDLIVHRILKEVLRESAEKLDGDVPVGVSAALESSAEEIHPDSAAPTGLRNAGATPWSKRRPREALEPLGGPLKVEELHEIAEESSQSERRADDAERELMEWKKVKFMQDRVGEDLDGLITSVTKFGFFVELTDLFVEGLVPLNTLTDDYYTYHENTRQIIGQHSRNTYSLGQRIRVLVDRIDPVEKKIQFAVLEEAPLRPTSKPSSRKLKRTRR
jgi:ribonuclease R